jgi:hypothetical protein
MAASRDGKARVSRVVPPGGKDLGREGTVTEREVDMSVIGQRKRDFAEHGQAGASRPNKRR